MFYPRNQLEALELKYICLCINKIGLRIQKKAVTNEKISKLTYKMKILRDSKVGHHILIVYPVGSTHSD